MGIVVGVWVRVGADLDLLDLEAGVEVGVALFSGIEVASKGQTFLWFPTRHRISYDDRGQFKKKMGNAI